MDNSKLIPEPLLTNVLNFIDEIGISENDKVLFRDGAQYGYNLAQVYVQDLEKQIMEMRKLFSINTTSLQFNTVKDWWAIRETLSIESIEGKLKCPFTQDACLVNDTAPFSSCQSCRNNPHRNNAITLKIDL